MNKTLVFVCAVVLTGVLLPCYAAAQGTDPPPCCNTGRHSVSPVSTQPAATPQNRFAISDSSLRLMGMSRSDFVDRLAGSLFFGKNVEFVVTISQPADPRMGYFNVLGDPAAGIAAAEGILMSVQEKRVYRIPRMRLRPIDIEALDQFSVTDGETYIEIAFTKTESSAALR